MRRKQIKHVLDLYSPIFHFFLFISIKIVYLSRIRTRIEYKHDDHLTTITTMAPYRLPLFCLLMHLQMVTLPSLVCAGERFILLVPTYLPTYLPTYITGTYLSHTPFMCTFPVKRKLLKELRWIGPRTK